MGIGWFLSFFFFFLFTKFSLILLLHVYTHLQVTIIMSSASDIKCWQTWLILHLILHLRQKPSLFSNMMLWRCAAGEENLWGNLDTKQPLSNNECATSPKNRPGMDHPRGLSGGSFRQGHSGKIYEKIFKLSCCSERC